MVHPGEGRRTRCGRISGSDRDPGRDGLIAGSVFGDSRFGLGVFGFLGGFLAGVAVGGALVAGAACGLLTVLIDIRNSPARR